MAVSGQQLQDSIINTAASGQQCKVAACGQQHQDASEGQHCPDCITGWQHQDGSVGWQHQNGSIWVALMLRPGWHYQDDTVRMAPSEWQHQFDLAILILGMRL